MGELYQLQANSPLASSMLILDRGNRLPLLLRTLLDSYGHIPVVQYHLKFTYQLVLSLMKWSTQSIDLPTVLVSTCVRQFNKF